MRWRNAGRTNERCEHIDATLDALGALRWESDGPAGPLRGASGAVTERTGLSPSAFVQADGWWSLVHPDDREQVQRERAAVASDGVSRTVDYRLVAAGVAEQCVVETVTVRRDRKGRVTGLQGIVADITERVVTASLIDRLTNLIDGVPFGMMVLDLQEPNDPGSLVISSANPMTARFFPIAAEDVGALRLGDLLDDPRLSVASRSELLRRLTGVAQGLPGFDQRIEIENRVMGDVRSVQLRALPLGDRAVGLIFDDRTASERAERVLAHRASHDVLTGLVNRAELLTRASRVMHERGEAPVTLLVVDLDRFKDVNDAFGHEAGDDVLRQVAERLREAASPEATVARVGGDEFAVLLPIGSTAADGVAVAARLAELLARPVAVGSWFQLEVLASTGIASVPEHAVTVEELLARADTAMYAAKSTSSGSYTTYSQGLERSSSRRNQLLVDLRRALTTEELQLHYQPIIRADGRVVGFEGLLRWSHPELGMVMPGEFIELVELGSLGSAVARTVVRRGIEHARQVHQASNGTAGVSINLTPRNLVDDEVVESLLRHVSDARLPSGTLTIELSERQLMEERTDLVEVIARIREAGIRVAVDDFGTGASSLRLLHRFEVDEIKIDRALTSDVRRGDDSLVRSIIELAHSLDKLVVAEGVEDDDLRGRLVLLGCDLMQGFGIARPMPAEAALAHLDGSPDPGPLPTSGEVKGPHARAATLPPPRSPVTVTARGSLRLPRLADRLSTERQEALSSTGS